MALETTTTRPPAPAADAGPGVPGDEEDTHALRAMAIRQAERLRKLRIHAVVYAAASVVLGVVWVLTEYFEEQTWPDRLADAPDVAGTWSPWYLWLVGIWGAVLALHAVRVLTHRRPTEEEIQRELRRMRRDG